MPYASLLILAPAIVKVKSIFLPHLVHLWISSILPFEFSFFTWPFNFIVSSSSSVSLHGTAWGALVLHPSASYSFQLPLPSLANHLKLYPALLLLFCFLPGLCVRKMGLWAPGTVSWSKWIIAQVVAKLCFLEDSWEQLQTAQKGPYFWEKSSKDCGTSSSMTCFSPELRTEGWLAGNRLSKS